MGAWKSVAQRGRIPCPRESQLAVALKDRWILLYGGYREKQKFRDFYIFDTESSSWFELDRYELKGIEVGGPEPQASKPTTPSKALSYVSSQPPYRENCTATAFEDSVYLFGGQNEEEQYCSDMYRVSLEHFNLLKRTQPPLLTISKVEYAQSRLPSARCSHSAVLYKERHLLVMGGERSTSKHELLNDIWSFDLLARTWLEIKPKHQHLFQKRESFTCLLYDTEVVIFGGLKDMEHATSLDDLLVLALEPTSESENEDFMVCARCSFPYRQREPQRKEHLVLSKPMSVRVMDGETVRNVAQMVGHPFKAIGLILENYMHRSGVFFNLSFVNGTFRLLSLNSVPFKPCEVKAKLLELSVLSEQCETVLRDRNAKLAAFRLCSEFLVVCRFPGETHFALHTFTHKLYFCLPDSLPWRDCQEELFQPIRTKLLQQNYTDDEFKTATQELIAFNCLDLDMGLNDIVVNDRDMVSRALSGRASLVEVSLRAYLSHYFLEWPTVTLWINNIPVELFSMKVRGHPRRK